MFERRTLRRPQIGPVKLGPIVRTGDSKEREGRRPGRPVDGLVA